METKSFLIEENAGTIFDLTEMDQWHDLVQVLGLEKQAELVQVGKSPLPFPVLTEAENEIYREIFDVHTDYKRFGDEAIPLKVLSLIALCEKEKYFDKIMIWHSRMVPDPLVIGLRYENEEDRREEKDWRALRYKIAVWGEKIKPVLELLPIWEEKKKAEHLSSYEYYMNNLAKQVERFKFQLGAVETPVKTKK